MDILQNLLTDIWVMTCEMAPYLLFGFLLAGLMHEYIPRRLYSSYLSRPTLRSVGLATAIGIPLPLCSCGVLPTAMSLRREGASHGATTAFLIATPQTGVDSIIATYSLMGLPFAILRPIAALFTALLGGTLVNTFTAVERQSIATESNTSQCSISSVSDTTATPWERLRSALHYAYVEMMGDIGRWLIVGLIAAGMITALVPDQWFSAFHDNTLLSILLVLCISIPMYVCATGSIPIAVALMMKGLTPGAALVLLMAGPACNIASMLVIHKVMGRRTLLLYLLSIVSGAILAALAIDNLMPATWFTTMNHAMACHQDGIQWLNITSAVLLLALLLNTLFHSHTHETTACAADTTTLHIQGMCCSHCATNIQHALESLEGIQQATVSLNDKTAVITGTAPLETIRQTIQSLGYDLQEE